MWSTTGSSSPRDGGLLRAVVGGTVVTPGTVVGVEVGGTVPAAAKEMWCRELCHRRATRAQAEMPQL